MIERNESHLTKRRPISKTL